MLITRETDYALRILRTLSKGDCCTVGYLAECEVLPQKFAYKIIKKLEKSGMVRIIRGAGGGCILACDLHHKTLYDLIETVETNARLTACMTPGYQCEWRGEDNSICTIHGQLARVQKTMNDEFRSRSLYWTIFGEEPADA